MLIYMLSKGILICRNFVFWNQ